MSLDHIPPGYHTLTSYFLVPDLAAYLEFLRVALDANVEQLLKSDDGSPQHAQVRIGDSLLMLGQPPALENPQHNMQYVHVPDVQIAYDKMLGAGATSVQAPEDQFYGHRTAAVNDMLGFQWWLAQSIEVLSPEELQRRNREAKPPTP